MARVCCLHMTHSLVVYAEIFLGWPNMSSPGFDTHSKLLQTSEERF